MRLALQHGHYAWLALVLAATLLLRLPSLFEPPWYDDEGIYAAVAHAMMRGATLYEDVLDNRTPGIYWLYAAMLGLSDYSIFFVKAVAALFVLLTQLTVFRIGLRLWGGRAGLLAAALLGLLASVPVLEGNTANSEIFMMLPSAVGVLLALRRRFLLSGAVFALAFLVKQVAGIEFAACLLAVLVFSPRPWPAAGRLVLGYSLPLAATAGYLVWDGTLDDFTFAGFLYYLGYVQRGARTGTTIPPHLWLIKLLLAAGAAAAVWRHYGGRRDGPGFERALILLWAVFALFGSFFTARPYPHYLIQAVPPLSLIAAAVAVSLANRSLFRAGATRVAAYGLAAAGGLLVLLMIYAPWPQWANTDRAVRYYQNFAMFVSGQRSLPAYNEFFDRRVNRNLALVRWLERNAAPEDYLMIWGEEPWLYALSGLRVAIPYTVSYYAYEMPSGLDRIIDEMQKRKPVYVVWTTNKPLYPKLKSELEQHYVERATLENAVIMQRTSTFASKAVPSAGYPVYGPEALDQP